MAATTNQSEAPKFGFEKMTSEKAIDRIMSLLNESAKAVTDEDGSDNLLGLVRDFSSTALRLQNLMGQRDAYRIGEHMYSILQDQGESLEVLVGIMSNLAERANQSADDSWSGRNNDMKRAHHDGYQDAMRDVIRYFEDRCSAHFSK